MLVVAVVETTAMDNLLLVLLVVQVAVGKVVQHQILMEKMELQTQVAVAVAAYTLQGAVLITLLVEQVALVLLSFVI
jgi:hypothetical protein